MASAERWHSRETRVGGCADGRPRPSAHMNAHAASRALLRVALAPALVLAACSSGGLNIRTTERRPLPRTGMPQWARYRQACERESDVCTTPGPTGSIPKALSRPLRFPAIAASRRCPRSPGHFVSTPDFAAVALGHGPVRIAVDNAGDLRHGEVNLPAAREFGGWYGIKTHFFSLPAYQGPFIVRAARIDSGGDVRLGASPEYRTALVVPPGPTDNGTQGWREVPYFTFVRGPGCYAWQLDGLTFSEVVIARVDAGR